MLFDISTGESIPVPIWADEIMQKEFPEFYNGIPLKIKVTQSKMLRLQKVSSSDKDGEIRTVIEAPTGNTRKARGLVVDPEDGYTYPVQYATTYPKRADGQISWGYPSGYTTLDNNMTVQPGQKDFLFYLYFLCPNIKGNKCINPAADPFYEFDRPEMDAKSKIDQAKSARELENMIYFDTPYEMVLKTIDGLALPKKNSEEENRVMLHDSIKNGSETFRKNAFEILDSRPKKQEVKAEETIHEMVNRLSSEGFIKNEDGIWYLRDRRGDGTKWLKNPLFESTGEKDAFALIDHLKVNDELLSKLRKL
jgi:hypothetical protein